MLCVPPPCAPRQKWIHVRCLIAEGGPVPDADETPGNVTVAGQSY